MRDDELHDLGRQAVTGVLLEEVTGADRAFTSRERSQSASADE